MAGEGKKPLFEPTFNRSIKIQGGDDRLTSDSGLLLLREADHKLGLIESLASQLSDPRRQDLIRYQMAELLRERIYALALGYQAQDDLDRLAHDPAMRMAVWDRPGDSVLEERVASQPTQSRLIDTLAHVDNNLEHLRRGLGEWTERHLRCSADHAARKGTIDIDSFPIEADGEQAGGAYNGYYKLNMYHPLVASFSVAGDYDSTREGYRAIGLVTGSFMACCVAGTATQPRGCCVSWIASWRSLQSLSGQRSLGLRGML